MQLKDKDLVKHADKGLADIEERRAAVNRRIGMYSIWVVLLGVALVMFFFGGGMDSGKRWMILALVVTYVAVRMYVIRVRGKKGRHGGQSGV